MIENQGYCDLHHLNLSSDLLVRVS